MLRIDMLPQLVALNPYIYSNNSSYGSFILIIPLFIKIIVIHVLINLENL